MLFRIILVVIITFISLLVGLTTIQEGNFIDYFKYALIGLVVSSLFIAIEYLFQRKNGKQVIFGIIGFTLGIIFAEFFTKIFLQFFPQINGKISLVFIIIFAYIGFVIGYFKSEEFEMGGFSAYKPTKELPQTTYKILDTSVIIDGRIADIAETNFLEGVFIVPKFVLKELQQVADSSDPLKRSRGRRGLDVLNEMKASKKIVIKISDKDFPEVKEVDAKLLKLAHIMGAIIITNDFNLNKVAEFQGVTVLNVNELTNAVKPIVLPNEELSITIIKEGKDQRQGIAYLDDGTMIVVDNGKDYIGKEVSVIVTSVLQTPAGRMIFTQLSQEKEKENREKDRKHYHHERRR